MVGQMNGGMTGDCLFFVRQCGGAMGGVTYANKSGEGFHEPVLSIRVCILRGKSGGQEVRLPHAFFLLRPRDVVFLFGVGGGRQSLLSSRGGIWWGGVESSVFCCLFYLL